MTKIELKRNRHAVFNLHLHLVFVTKYRKSVFTDEILVDCEEIMRAVTEEFGGELVEFNGEEDHIHLLVSVPPTVQPSKLVNSLKGVSSRLLRQKHSSLKKYLWNGRLWSRSYFVSSCGGAPLSIIKEYIQSQDRPVRS